MLDKVGFSVLSTYTNAPGCAGDGIRVGRHDDLEYGRKGALECIALCAADVVSGGRWRQCEDEG